ncbi:hypothetical protein B0H14DRAFT_2748197 [Mycena olivaceomarginata]|nr:hypothetical protein B0H14DRAFT_2748197 [Mycena olivaceomarginata]
MSESDAQPELTRVEDLWFSDATLILRAEDTLFRVYSGFLGARSSVFRDMVAFPQPSEPDGDTVDGLAVVRLHDSAAEVEVFLRAIFDSGFFKPPPFAVNFTAVIGVMRLAHKYDVQYLFRRALSHLDLLYPTDFSTFMALPDDNTEHHVTGCCNRVTLEAASEVGASWILPTAYYEISNDILDDIKLNILQPCHQRICLGAHSHFIRAMVMNYRFFRNLPHSSCLQVSRCQELISQAHTVLESWSDEQLDLDPLADWVFVYTGQTLCSACDAFGRKEFEVAQKRFWEGLPHIFKLPAWDELIEMRRKAMDGPM